MPDESVTRLAELFRSHPARTQAAALLAEDACSNVRFRHRPGEVWHLARVEGVTRLVPGARPDADPELTFSPAAIERLAQTRAGIPDFALALFELAVDPDPALGVELRILAPFLRLVRRGYLRLIVAGGPSVLAWGAAHGVRSLGDLRRWIARVRAGHGVSEAAGMPQDPAARPAPRARRRRREP
jgi:hypothetical protein